MTVRIVTRGPGAAPERCRAKRMHLTVTRPGAPGTVRLTAMGYGRRIWHDLTEEAAEELAADIRAADRPYRQPSDCETPGRYMSPRGAELWRLDEDDQEGWQRWDEAAGEWVDDMPDELLHYVPPVDGEVA